MPHKSSKKSYPSKPGHPGKSEDTFTIARSKTRVRKPSEKEISGMRQREIQRKNRGRTA